MEAEVTAPTLPSVPYSPRKIQVASFIGGPLAAHWFLSANFTAMAQTQRAGRVLAVGGLILVAMFPVVLVLPSKTPNTVVPILYSIGYYYYAKTKCGPGVVSGFTATGWRAWVNLVGISIACIVLTMITWVLGILAITKLAPNLLH
jgi:hypothetical protein